MFLRTALAFCQSLVQGLNRDPLIAHAFQWALYEKQMEKFLEPKSTGFVEFVEAVHVPTRDAFTLLDYPRLSQGDRPELAFVGLRNLLSASVAAEQMSEEIEAFLGFSSELSYGSAKAAEVVVEVLNRVRSSSRIHAKLAAMTLPELPLESRLVVRAGLKDLNAFLLGIVSICAELRARSVFPNLARAFTQLNAVFASIDRANLSCLAPPLGDALRDVGRLISVFRTLELFEEEAGSKGSYNMRELNDFLCSVGYRELAQHMRRSTASVGAGEASEDEWMQDLFDTANLEDAVVFVRGNERLGVQGPTRDELAMRLSQAGILLGIGDIVNRAEALVRMRQAAHAVFSMRRSTEAQLLQEAVRSEFYGMLVVFCTAAVHPLRGLLRVIATSRVASEAIHAIEQLIPPVLKALHPASLDKVWLAEGNKEMARSAAMVVLKLLELRKHCANPDLQKVSQVINAIRVLEALFKKLSSS